MKADSYVAAVALTGLVLLVVSGGLLVFSESLNEAPLQDHSGNDEISVEQGAWHYLSASDTPRASGTDSITVTDSSGTPLNESEDYTFEQDRLRVSFTTCGEQTDPDACASHGEDVTVEYEYEAPPESQTDMHSITTSLMAALPWLALVFAPLGILALFGALYKVANNNRGYGGR